MLCAVIARAPAQANRFRLDDGENIDRHFLKRTQRIAALKPHAPATRQRGTLPFCLRFLTEGNAPLVVGLEIILETIHTPDALRHFVVPSGSGGGMVRHDGLTLTLSGIEWPRVSLVANPNGCSLETTFAAPDDLLAPPASEIAMRVYVDLRGLVEFARLLAGDAAAEHRIAEHVGRPHGTMATPALPPPSYPEHLLQRSTSDPRNVLRRYRGRSQ